MKHFIDTEFIEGFHKPIFGKRRHHIDLISIGIVAEDGREYYAISSEYDYKDASLWVRENVILPMFINEINKGAYNCNDSTTFQKAIGKPLKTIAKEIKDFIGNESVGETHEFYGYFADYDWVVFCSLFGTMMDLPPRFPMYCNDLKQILDEKAKTRSYYGINQSFEEKLKYLKASKWFPKQKNEHHALFDARWNRDLFNFLKTI